MDNTEIQERLAQMDETYKKLKERGDQPVGDFQAIIDRFDFFEGKNDGHTFLKTFLTIRHDPDWDGEEVAAIHNITDPDRAAWTLRYLRTIGYEGPISELLSALEDYVGLPVAITCKEGQGISPYTGLPYLNVFINQRLGELQTPGSDVDNDTSGFKGGGPLALDGSDIPFGPSIF